MTFWGVEIFTGTRSTDTAIAATTTWTHDQRSLRPLPTPLSVEGRDGRNGAEKDLGRYPHRVSRRWVVVAAREGRRRLAETRVWLPQPGRSRRRVFASGGESPSVWSTGRHQESLNIFFIFYLTLTWLIAGKKVLGHRVRVLTKIFTFLSGLTGVTRKFSCFSLSFPKLAENSLGEQRERSTSNLKIRCSEKRGVFRRAPRDIFTKLKPMDYFLPSLKIIQDRKSVV